MKAIVPSKVNPATARQQSTPEPVDGDINFRQLVEDSPMAFYSCDRQGHITFFNQAAVRLWGRSPKVGKDLWCGSLKMYYPDGRPMPLDQCPMAKTLRDGISHENQRINIERPDGSLRSILVFPRPVFDKNQNLIGAHNTLVDITEQQTGEFKQATLSAIVESSDDAIISKDLNGTIISWNSGAERIFKYTSEEIVGKHITLLIPDSCLSDEALILESVKKGNRVDHFETIRKDKYGREIPISITVSPVRDTGGNIVGASKVARDISDRLNGEERQAILSAIVESSDDAIISKDLNGIIRSWNAGAEKIFGYSEPEVVGKPVTILIPTERMSEEDHILGKIRSGERLDHFETFRLTKSGQEIPISLTVSPIKDSRGNIIGASKIARDISAQVRSQAEIKKYARNLEVLNSIGKSISENMDVEIILQRVTDATTKLTGAAFGAFFYNANEEGEDYVLFTLSGAPKKSFERLGMPRDTDVFHPTFNGEPLRTDDITTDPRFGHNFPHFGLPEGHLPVKSYLAVPVVSNSGKVIGGLFFGHPEKAKFTSEHQDMVINIATQAAISLDNSELFEQVKTLSAKKDEFIALASHELRTPLTTIKGYLQMLATEDSEKMAAMFLKKSLNQVNKLNTLVEDLLHMSRMESGKLEFNLENFDLRKMLLEMAEVFGYSHKSHKLIQDLGQKPAIVKADKQRIEQVIHNLLSNAVKYSPRANEVYLSLELTDTDVTIKVRDEGFGLTPEQQRQIFTRFYRAESTRGISGLGLGLYLSKQIIDHHRGVMKVKSKYGEGSEFFFTLPLIK